MRTRLKPCIVSVQEGARIIPLRRTGYLTVRRRPCPLSKRNDDDDKNELTNDPQLDIQIPDPHLGPDTGASRPNTDEDERPRSDVHPAGDYDNYPLTPALQVDPSSPLAVGTRS